MTKEIQVKLANSEYPNYLLRACYDISGIDNAFQNVQLISQETLVPTTKEIWVKLANASSIAYFF